MDNDKKIVKKIKSIIKKTKFRWDYRGLDILNDNAGNGKIAELIESTRPIMIARAGATEMRCVQEYLSKGTFSDKIKREISELSGVFSNDNESLKKFCEIYISSMSEADFISLWGVGAESTVVKKYCQNAVLSELHALEPYYFNNPWSKVLLNKKVLIIHPFASTIKSQYGKREYLFENKETLPKFEKLICIKAVQTIAGQKTDFETWFDALEYMKKEIDKVDFDVAIIGAGAYGLPLTAYIKSIGKKAIQMSGATQLLFGICGNRWDKHPYISKLYNVHWVRPSADETPRAASKVEGGSYW